MNFNSRGQLSKVMESLKRSEEESTGTLGGWVGGWVGEV